MTPANIAEIQADCDGEWVGDGRRVFKTGEYGFLLEVVPHTGRPRLEIRPQPVRTSGSLDDLLYGFVEGDRTDVEALGVARVTAVTSTGGRAQILTVWGGELDAALLELGYPRIDRGVYVDRMSRAA